jgi:SHS family lactate transporter-like MFS transporter
MEAAMQKAWWREPTKGQWCTFLAAWVGWVLDAFDFTIFLLVMPQMARDLGVGVTAAAGSITLTLLVRLVGGAAAGAAADRWGRKLPLMISLVWFAVCDGAVAFAPSFGWVLALRAIFGFGMGAEWTSGATLAMENWPERSRGIASGILQGSWAVGYLLAAVVSAHVVPHWGWRGLFLVAAAPALVVLPIRIWVPESADFRDGKRNRERERERARSVGWNDLIGTIAWASGVMALGFGAYYGLTGLYPTLLAGLGRNAHGVASLVSLFNIGMMVGAVACGAIAARWGVRRAVALPALLALPILPLYVGASPSLLPLGALLGGAFGAGFSGIVPLFLTSLFPADVRARCVGIVYHIGALFAAFVPTLVAALTEHAGLPLGRAILFVAGACELGLVLVMSRKRHAIHQIVAVEIDVCSTTVQGGS